MTRTVPSPEQSGELVGRLRQYGHVEAADALESAQAEIARLTADIGYHAEQVATYIAQHAISISEKDLASARFHNDKIRAVLNPKG